MASTRSACIALGPAFTRNGSDHKNVLTLRGAPGRAPCLARGTHTANSGDRTNAETVPHYPRDRLGAIDESLDCYGLVPNSPWGFAVYRTAYDNSSYGSDAAWRRMVALLESEVVSSLEAYDRMDLLARHKMVVFDDRAALEGATHDDVRKRFDLWAAEELHRNRVGGAKLYENKHYGPRYCFCLMVDDICLESLDPNLTDTPVVKLVTSGWDVDPESWAEWERDSKAPYKVPVVAWPPGDKGEYYWQYPEPDKEDPLPWEGGFSNCEFEDVGWMYKEVWEYVDSYDELADAHGLWDEQTFYLRPPLTHSLFWGSPSPGVWDFDRAPGSWRRKGKGGKPEA